MSAVSFDFDDTLTTRKMDQLTELWISSGEPNFEILSELFRYACHYWTIYIITDRNKVPFNEKVINEFIERNGLPVEKIIYSGTADKYKFMNKLNISVHFDDDKYQLEKLPKNITGILVKKKNKEKESNLLAKSMNMIGI